MPPNRSKKRVWDSLSRVLMNPSEREECFMLLISSPCLNQPSPELFVFREVGSPQRSLSHGPSTALARWFIASSKPTLRRLRARQYRSDIFILLKKSEVITIQLLSLF